MVEVIRGHHTSEETLATARQILTRGQGRNRGQRLPRFVSNRVLMLTVNEAVYLVHDGVAPADRSITCQDSSATRWGRSRPPT